MRRTALFVSIFLSSSICLGCLGRQIAQDGKSLGQAILDMYTDQVMDNLVRARSNMPFVQLKYSQIQATDSVDLTATGAVDQTIATAGGLVLDAVTRTLTNDYKAAATGDQKRAMNFTADPITDQNDIYLKYLAFANNPSLFVVGDTKPSCPVHILRKCGHKFYWVPSEAGPAFLELALQTTFMRGKEDGVVTLAAVAVKIVDVEHPDPIIGRDAINAVLLLDKSVPNGPATLIVDLESGRKVRMDIWPLRPQSGQKPVDLGQPTTRFEAQWSPKKDQVKVGDLTGRPARFYSHDFPPEVQPPSPILQSINTNLNTIRAEVQLQNVGH
jgi:hypothetical protein